MAQTASLNALFRQEPPRAMHSMSRSTEHHGMANYAYRRRPLFLTPLHRYHSHFSSQYGNGIVGPLVVHGPASANYDIDLGPYMIMDYYYETADRLQRRAELLSGGPPDSDNILFRGKNIKPGGTGGSYDKVTLTRNKKHLLRLINTSVDNSFTVSLVGHNFTVIAMDLVPITPVVRTKLFMGVGQRYDVIIEANQAVDNYWLNATLESANNCGRSKNLFPAAIFHYDTAGNGNPTNKGTPIVANCEGETGFAPIVTRTVPASGFTPSPISVALSFPTVDFRGQVFRWLVNNVDIEIDWDHPILEYVANGSTSYPPKANIIQVPQANVWTYWIIQNGFFLPHPVHLHGHDFLVLGTGAGTFDAAQHTSLLNFNNPIRRDVAQMPGSGWLVIAFKTDNPGCWLLHCHIAWHVSQGLGIQFLERRSEIPGLMHLDQMEPNCRAWRAYVPTSHWLPKIDSGLRKKSLGAY
jgi:FtsP/CotA-like multicopper oxidase with cupredoxin domain